MSVVGGKADFPAARPDFSVWPRMVIRRDAGVRAAWQ